MTSNRWQQIERIDHAARELEKSARPADLLALDDALSELARMDPRKAQVVDMRFFSGPSVQIAEVLKVIANHEAERKRHGAGVMPAPRNWQGSKEGYFAFSAMGIRSSSMGDSASWV